jgi:hypothetical protein
MMTSMRRMIWAISLRRRMKLMMKKMMNNYIEK